MPDIRLPAAVTGQAPMGSSPLSPPTGNPGQQAAALSQVRQAIDMLQKALPNLAIGSDAHKEVLKSINSISKIVPASAEVAGVQGTNLRGLQQDAAKSAMMQALERSMGAQTPSMGGGAPAESATPSPSAGA